VPLILKFSNILVSVRKGLENKLRVDVVVTCLLILGGIRELWSLFEV
jgi:hypothetical protein